RGREARDVRGPGGELVPALVDEGVRAETAGAGVFDVDGPVAHQEDQPAVQVCDAHERSSRGASMISMVRPCGSRKYATRRPRLGPDVISTGAALRGRAPSDDIRVNSAARSSVTRQR